MQDFSCVFLFVCIAAFTGCVPQDCQIPTFGMFEELSQPQSTSAASFIIAWQLLITRLGQVKSGIVRSEQLGHPYIRIMPSCCYSYMAMMLTIADTDYVVRPAAI